MTVSLEGQQREQRMAWWREARFGMFVHWGVYSVTGGEYKGEMPTNSAEWMMNNAGKVSRNQPIVPSWVAI